MLFATDGDRGGPEGDKAEGPHADRLVREITVETNEAARGGGGEQAYEHIAEVKVHGSHPSVGGIILRGRDHLELVR
jgi:hypothetical protein